VHAKERHHPELFQPLAAQLAAALEVARMPERVDIVVPVPSSIVARLRRGFDPAREIARELSRRFELPLRPRALGRRSLSGRAFKGLGAAARRRRAERHVMAREALIGLRVLLVDDVMTTGATAGACAQALRDAGATTVLAAVWARTPTPRASL